MKHQIVIDLYNGKMQPHAIAEAAAAACGHYGLHDYSFGGLPRATITTNTPFWSSNFEDVELFHRKFGVPMAAQPAFLDAAAAGFRQKFMQEELDEFADAVREGNMAKAFDALLDLAYVAKGTAAMMGLPWQAGWDLVQIANMAKERATRAEDSKRGSLLDVIKPPGWVAPDHSTIIGDGPFPTFMTSSGTLVWPAQEG